jgi:hypothetical protein
MEFILLIFVNVIMGTIFYLILRLRLEKHASDYREKRLKREIDEIISVFNETAERNITILENRIEYLKKLLEKSGTIDNIDFKIDDSKYDGKEIKETEKKEKVVKTSKHITNIINDNLLSALEITDIETGISEKTTADNQEENYRSISKFYLQIKEKLTITYRSLMGHKPGMVALYNKNGHSFDLKDNPARGDNLPADVLSGSSDVNKGKDYIIDSETYLSDPDLKDDVKNDKVLSGMDYELEQMFRTSEDKYLLISELFNEGYSTEVICKCSGIPIGEIKLVLDLNSKA